MSDTRQITLSLDDASTLMDVLTDRLGDLSTEIAATDNPTYRKLLRERRATLQRVVGALSPAGSGAQ